MRRPSIYTERRGPLDVKMTPMIDVVFLLLVFFIWTSSFQIAEYALQSNISDATGSAPAELADPPPEADFPDVVVRVLWSQDGPAWLVNDVRLASLAEVRSRLQLVYQANQQAPVIIHPDDETPLEHVIDVYDISRLVGFSKVQLTASTSA